MKNWFFKYALQNVVSIFNPIEAEINYNLPNNPTPEPSTNRGKQSQIGFPNWSHFPGGREQVSIPLWRKSAQQIWSAPVSRRRRLQSNDSVSILFA